MENGRPNDVLERLRSGAPDDWDDAARRFGPLLLWVVRRHRLTPEDAADVVQTTWLRLWENLDRVRDPDALAGWLVTTCRRESLRTLRLRARTVPRDPGDATWCIAATDGDGDPHDDVARRFDAATLYAAVGDLPERQRAVLLVMLDNDGASYAETSRILGLPIGSLGPTRMRALARLRRDRRLACDVRKDLPGDLSSQGRHPPALRRVR
jgi:RNA polymerase sigma factor (sigma-70 family)